MGAAFSGHNRPYDSVSVDLITKIFAEELGVEADFIPLTAMTLIAEFAEGYFAMCDLTHAGDHASALREFNIALKCPCQEPVTLNTLKVLNFSATI